MKEKLMALTFDDGPNTEIMPAVMDILKAYGVKATFFLIGEKIVEDTIPVIRRAVAEGHELANHSYSHLHMSQLNEEQIRQEIALVQQQAQQYAGVTPVVFRPPFIDVSETMCRTISMPFIVGVDSRDWDPSTTAAERIQRVLGGAEDGAVVLMHCMDNNHPTLEALHTILPKLREEGYSFVTVSELFAAKGVQPQPGVRYDIVR